MATCAVIFVVGAAIDKAATVTLRFYDHVAVMALVTHVGILHCIDVFLN